MASEEILKRVLPHSIEAEQSVIGSMILDREAITIASEIIMDEDFYNKQYGVLFDTMIELNNEGNSFYLTCNKTHPGNRDFYRYESG